MLRIVGAIFLLWGSGSFLHAAEESAADAAPAEQSESTRDASEEWIELFPGIVQGEVRTIHEFFGTRLPNTLGKYNLSLEYTPKFGDFVNREYLRFPLTLRYGLTDRTDLLLGVTPFAANPFRHGDDHRWGPGLVRTGARHRLDSQLLMFHRTAVGFDVQIPMGRPPLSLADYYGRARPFVSFSRDLDSLPHTEFLLGLMHDHAFAVPFRDEDHAFLKAHRTEISPGLLYKPGNLGYLGEYTLRLLDEQTGYRKANVYTVGLIWDVPQKWVPRFLPGEWRIDTAYQLTDEDERDLKHAVRSRIHVRFDFPVFVREVRERRQRD